MPLQTIYRFDLDTYLFWLILLSLVVYGAEKFWPRIAFSAPRPYFKTDLFLLFFNGEISGFVVACCLSLIAFPDLKSGSLLQGYSLWIQVPAVFVLKDFFDYWIHRGLHKFDFLWQFHKVHHSATRMDFLICFRFHFVETFVYKSVGYFVLLSLGAVWQAVFISAVLSTLIGHLNHSNLNLDYGPLRYVLNHPTMHIWHHEVVENPQKIRNFGINLSLWDFIFKTAYLDSRNYPVIGLPQGGSCPKSLFHFPSLFLIACATFLYFWL